MTGVGDRNSAGTAGSIFSVQKALFLIGFLLLTSFNLHAQRKYDLGVFAGTSYYMGDMNISQHFQSPALAAGPIVRYNINLRNSIRAHAFYHSLSGEYPDDPNYIHPGLVEDFASNFVDLGLDFEFNWKPYKTANRKTLASPYVFAGLGYGLAIPFDFQRSHLTIPFGVGYKINVGRWLSLGLEAGARKTFSDLVDGSSNAASDVRFAPFANRDWYFFTGAFVTYKIFKFWESCPTYD